MSGYAQELTDIEQRLLDNWTGYPIQFGEGPECVDPATGNLVKQPDSSAWVRLTVRGALEEQAALGGGNTATLWRNRALITAQIFAPVGERQLALTMGETLASIYRGASFSTVSCQAASVREVGIVNGWQQVNVDIPFYRDFEE